MPPSTCRIGKTIVDRSVPVDHGDRVTVAARADQFAIPVNRGGKTQPVPRQPEATADFDAAVDHGEIRKAY